MPQWVQEIALAFSFLTILPMPTVAYQPGRLGRAGRWFPVVGLVIGILLTGAQGLLLHFFSPLLTAALVTTLWAALTGGLHLDGLADCCDGLLAATGHERRLEIMRDPRTGAFAVIGLALFLIVKVTAIAALPTTLPALLLAPTGGRWLLLWVARQPAARSGGLGADFAAGLTTSTLLWALIAPVALGFIFPSLHLLIAGALAGGITWWIIRVVRTRLGGVTGDVFGLVVELSEVAVLLAYASTKGS